ncbi:MAG: hypothetical protein ACREDF_08270 [Thermoplasmata archaeon]
MKKDGELVWNVDHGFCPTRPDRSTYSGDYWNEYIARSEKPMGRSLTDARINLVQRYLGKSLVVDIGIGSGQFVQTRLGYEGITFGYDVNPFGVRWLVERNLWWDPYFQDPPSVTFWDSLEHIERPDDLLSRVQRFIFMSIPIFLDREHVLRSKHFKPSEHFWYFTRDGLVLRMDRNGFRLREENTMETNLGREDIRTFVFEKRLTR